MKKLTILFVALVLALTLAACGTPHPQGLVFKTADENLSILFLIPPAEVVPAEEVGAVEPDPLPEPPCDYMEGDECLPIKGNIGRTGKIFHVPGGANYGQVLIDESKGEAFFRTEQEAIDAGFRKAAR